MAEEYAEQLFLQEKPTLALLTIGSLEKTYASVVTKEINSTFAHTTKILSKMEEYGLVKFTVEGRIKYIELTERGCEVVSRLKDLIDSLNFELRENEEEEESDNKEQPETLPEGAEMGEGQIQERINRLRLKIEKIYKQSIENGADPDSITRKLGPFKREIKMIEDMIESQDQPVNEMTLISFKDTRNRLDTLIQKK